jgi:hypothetical protein
MQVFSDHYFCPILIKLGFIYKFQLKFPNTKFDENPFRSSRTVSRMHSSMDEAILTGALHRCEGGMRYETAGFKFRM